MALRSGGRKLSFDILAASDYDDVSSSSLTRSHSDPPPFADSSHLLNRKKSKKKRNKKKSARIPDPVPENVISENSDVNYSCTLSTVTETLVLDEADSDRTVTRPVQFGELRQRNVSSAMTMMNGESEESVVGKSKIGDDDVKEVIGEKLGGGDDNRDLDRRKVLNGQKSTESLDWNKWMGDDPKYTLPVDKSPMKYFMEEMYAGNSIRTTTTLGNDKERERVYDTIFRSPWRCELLIDVGFFVCLDTFLSLLTIMPTRIMISFWSFLKTRQFKRPSPAELSDFGSLVILVAGVTLLQQADISLIYHMIRGQGTIKLYVVYNVLEIFDKLCQSFGGDIMQALFHSADGLANCSPENMNFWLWRFISDEALAVASSNILVIHSFILLAQAITLSTCIVAHNNALFAMLVSNNFAEIKSNVFKRYSKDNVQSLVYFDSVERFHISAFILFVLAQNMLEAEGPWFESFLCNALVVFLCEVMIDIIKHSFIAKFNEIKPTAFSEFLEDLCKQTLAMETDNVKKNLTFVPLAPACVVIRVFRPVYAAHLPHNPFLWRLFWICILFSVTFVMLTSLKIMIGMGLRKHARWYVKRCEKRKFHTD